MVPVLSLLSLRQRWVACVMCLLMLPGQPLYAQPATPAAAAPTPAAMSKRQRLALVIGIGTLGGKVTLDSARRDSEAVAAALRAGGFEVLLREDVNAADLRAAFKAFRDKLQANAVGLIYFTGLAAQVDGRNLLLPSDVGLAEGMVPFAVSTVLRAAGVPLQEAVDVLAGGTDAPRLLLVDAAYRHPALARLAPQGLARQRLAPGTMVLLGHAPAALQEMPNVEPLPTPPPKDVRETAATRFARVVVDALSAPRISAPEALRAIRLAVVDSSRGLTQPWLAGETFAREDLADAALLDNPVGASAGASAGASGTASTTALVPAAAASAADEARRTTDGRTAAAPGRGERPVYQARINSFNHAEGDILSYQLSDTRKDELLLSYTLAIEEVKPDGHLVLNGGRWQLDPQGRTKSRQEGEFEQSTFEPVQDIWWSRPQAGESRAVAFKETYVRADKTRGQIDWRGNAQVGSQRVLETTAGDFDVLPIKTTGQAVETPAGGQPLTFQFVRTVWYSPKLGVPVAIDIEDNDNTGRPLRRERIELTHAQQARTAN